MSQLIHAIIEARAPIKERLRVHYEGEGDDRVCIVSAIFKGEDQPREYRSPRLGDRKPKPRQSRDGEEWAPGSPLWQTKPDLQQFYDASRDFARVYFPDVLLGIYTKEEMEEVGYTKPAPAAPPPPDDGGLTTRLSASALARAGFPAEAAAATIDAELAKRDNSGGATRNSLSVEPDGAPTSPPENTAAPSPAEGSGTAAEPSPASEPQPTDESRPRVSRRRRRPPGDEARLV
jgi:hypothetical protein